MWAENLVSQLSAKASQVLLALLLTRQVQVQKTAMEFAKLTGLGQRSIAPALLELKSAGLIQIIAQPGKPPLVRLIHPEEYRHDVSVTEADPEAVGPVESPALLAGGAPLPEHRAGDRGSTQGVGETKANLNETSVVEVGPEHLGTAETPALAPPAAGVGVAGGETGAGGIQGVAPDRLIDQCRMADESKDRELRIAALQDVWDFAFPYDEYPNQRLSNLNAQRLLVNRGAEWVGQVILDSVQHATSRIQAPRAYIQKAVDMEERRGSGSRSGSESVITDEVRRAAQLGKELFGEKNSEGYF